MLKVMILGIDEVGRGCWAGPLCVGAVIIGEDTDRGLLSDSKKLSAKKRLIAADNIRKTAAAIGVGWASAKFIDNYGLSKALQHATRRAVDQISIQYSEIILDGTVNFLPDRQVTLLPKADDLIPAVSAASIIAKVARDRYMQVVDSHFEGYGFGSHVGYGTASHRRAIDELGPTPLHRMSFAPLVQLLPPEKPGIRQTSGYLAEKRAAEYLEGKGYEVLARNWKTKWCEIDIIAHKDGVIYFTEVKYRRKNLSGRGIDYVTAAKQRQMKFAAQLWLLQQKTNNSCQLAAVEVSGEDFAVTEFVDTIY